MTDNNEQKIAQSNISPRQSVSQFLKFQKNLHKKIYISMIIILIIGGISAIYFPYLFNPKNIKSLNELICYNENELRICKDENLEPYTGIAYEKLKNGHLISETNWKNGLLNGQITIYYDNGQLREKVYRQNGILEGKAIEYYQNGNLKSETFWENGKQIGISKLYHSNGVLKEEAFYEDGIANGNVTEYYEDGSVMSEAMFDNGILVGIIKEYNRNGTIQFESMFEEGELISKTCYDEEGSKIECN